MHGGTGKQGSGCKPAEAPRQGEEIVLILFHFETASYLATQNDLELVDSQGSSQLPKHWNYRMYTVCTMASSIRKDVCMCVCARAMTCVWQSENTCGSSPPPPPPPSYVGRRD